MISCKIGCHTRGVDYGLTNDYSPCRLGFAILQAFPGPNFAFAAYLGVLAVPSNPVLGAFLGYLGIFTPGILLKLALLPLYKVWREYAIAKSALRGLNAAAVGLIYTAVWQLFLGMWEPRALLGSLANVMALSSRAHLHVGRGNDGLDGQRCSHCRPMVGRRRRCEFCSGAVVSLTTSSLRLERSRGGFDLVRCKQDMNWALPSMRYCTRHLS